MDFCGCCCKKKSNKCRMTCVGIMGILLVIFGAVYLLIYDSIFYAVLKQQTEIREGTIIYPEWKAPEGDIVFCYFYFMNITNAEEFGAQTPDKFVKPIVEQKGPYVYKGRIEKDNIVPLDDLSPKEIRYRQTFNFYFDEERTVESTSDIITTINYIALAVGPSLDHIFSLPQAENITAIQKRAAYESMNQLVKQTNSTTLITATVNDLIWGFEDPLVTAMLENLENILASLGLSDLLPPLPETVGLFKKLNETRGWHTYQSYTGDPEYWLTNMLTTVDNKTELKYWFGDKCNMINGSDGTLRPPLGKREETLYHFYPSACRATYVSYVQDTTVKKIPGWEYRPPAQMFEAPSTSDYNDCFCEKDSTEVYCQNGGAQYLGQCYYGAPLMLSAPHFLHSDEFYFKNVEGLNPNVEEHGTFFIYEPNTGAALTAQKKLQFSLLVQPNEYIEISQQIGETFACPIMWVNGTYLVSDEDASLIYGSMVISRICMIVLQAILIAVGVGLLAYVAWYYNYHYEKDYDKKEKLEKEEDDTKDVKENGFVTDSKATIL